MDNSLIGVFVILCILICNEDYPCTGEKYYLVTEATRANGNWFFSELNSIESTESIELVEDYF